MARFVKLTMGGDPVHINAEHVTHFYSDCHSETGSTAIYLLDESYVRVTESLDEVEALLSGEADTEPLLAWKEEVVDDREHDPMGLFRRRFYCPYCGAWTSYGRPPYCPYCGHAVATTNRRKEAQEHD